MENKYAWLTNYWVSLDPKEPIASWHTPYVSTVVFSHISFAGKIHGVPKSSC